MYYIRNDTFFALYWDLLLILLIKSNLSDIVNNDYLFKMDFHTATFYKSAKYS